MNREKVLATVVRLMERSLIRIGNEAYAAQNGSFGLTTLRNEHLAIWGAKLELRFQGKSGVKVIVGIRDSQLAKIVRRCKELPGQELF